jgi:hypothetical protein
MRSDEICLKIGSIECGEHQALISNHNTMRNLFWWAEIVLPTADGHKQL